MFYIDPQCAEKHQVMLVIGLNYRVLYQLKNESLISKIASLDHLLHSLIEWVIQQTVFGL